MFKIFAPLFVFDFKNISAIGNSTNDSYYRKLLYFVLLAMRTKKNNTDFETQTTP